MRKIFTLSTGLFLLLCTSQAQVNLTNIAPTSTQNFDGMGTGTALPANWRMGPSTTSPTWAGASNLVTQQASTGTPTAGGTYNWGENGTTERAVGAMTSGVFSSPNNLLHWLKNNGTTNINDLTISYRAERYRINSSAVSIEFYWSTNGSAWTPVTTLEIVSGTFATGSSSYTFASPQKVSRTATISGVNIAPGANFYLRWNINTSGANSQGIGIDDVSATGVFEPPVCTAPSTQDHTVSFNSISNTAANISWTRGDGTGTVVVMNESNSFSNTLFVAGYNPTANSTYNTTTGGEQVIYNGSGTNFTVNGLDPNSTYYVRVYAYCTPNRVYNTSTATGNPANFTTTNTGSSVDWGNLSGPATGSVPLGNAFNVYGQVYATGITEAAGAGPGIKAWAAVSTSNTNPNSWPGSAWVAAIFDQSIGNNDQWVANLQSKLTPEGTYYYAFRYQLGAGPFYYGGYSGAGGGSWDGTNNVSGIVTVDVPDWVNLQWPPNGDIDVGSAFTAYGRIYEVNVTSTTFATASPAITGQIGWSFTNTNPNTWTNWSNATYNSGWSGDNNDEYQSDLGATLAAAGFSTTTRPITVYYASRFKLSNGPWLYGGYSAGGGNIWNGTSYTSGVLTLHAPEISVSGNGNDIADGSNITSATNHTQFGTVCVGQNFSRTFTISNTGDRNLVLGAAPTVTITGADASQFSVQTQPSSPVGTNSSTTFVVRFWPTSAGNKTAIINFSNNDPNEGNYDFVVQGLAEAAPVIGTSPSSPAAVCGTYSGTLTASGITGNNLVYSWEYSADGSTNWTTVANATPLGTTYTGVATASLTITALGQTSYYRLAVSNACTPVYSNVVTVTANPIPAVPSGSISGSTLACGSSALTINSTAPAGTTYYWQTSAGGVATSNSGSNYTVTSSNTYYVRARNNTTLCWGTATTGFSASIITPVSITAEPTTQILTSPSTANFTVSYSGTGTIQWQVDAGSGFVNATGAPYSGTTSNTLTVSPTNVSYDGYLFRAIITPPAPCIPDTSAVAELLVTQGPCGVESFTNNNAPTGIYNNGSFIGDMGLSWSYVNGREAQSAGYAITGKGMMFQNASGKITSSSFTGGIGSFTCKLLKGFTGSGNRQVELFVNGVSKGVSVAWNNTTVQTFTINNINISGNIVVEIRNIMPDQVVIDDISWTCYAGCTPTQTITGFTPSAGPAFTKVTISGTNFSGATQVDFGGVAATPFTIVDNNTIVVEVPSTAFTGKIGVTVAGCKAQSSSDFTVISSNNNCGIGTSGASDLIISEVFDSRVGSLSYVEIFNPTAGTISLSSYYIRVITNGTTISDMPALTGSLASGATGIVRFGDPNTSGSSTCAVTTLQTNDLQSGFNGNDQVILRKSTSDLDVVNNPWYGDPNPSNDPSNSDYFKRGFSQLRNAGAITPRTNYQPADWTYYTEENCNHLGIAPASVSTNNVTISGQPIDRDCNSFTFSVTASVTPGAAVYVWRYHAPGSSSWALASSLNGTNGLVVTSGLPTLTITGNIALLKDYQFYVDIESSGTPNCIRASQAAQFTYDSRPIYQSIGSGNWSDPTKWQMSNDEVSWVAACSYPVAANSTKVYVRAGHILTYNLENEQDWVVIDNGGTLSSANTAKLTLNNGNSAGADLMVNGTWIDNYTSGNNITFNTNATWQIANSSTAYLIKTNSSSANAYRDYYETGISNMPVAPYWIYRYVGTDGLSPRVSVVTSNMYYPNLIFESISINHDFNNSFEVFKGDEGGYATVKGNLFIGNSQPYWSKVYNNNSNTTPFTILGNVTVDANSVLSNIDQSAALYVENGTGMEVKGNMLINGSFVNIGSTNAIGKLTLSGGTQQTLSGTGTMTNYELDINNSAGVINNLVHNVFGNMIFTAGIVTTNATRKLTLEAAAVFSNPATSRFIHGPVSKVFNASYPNIEFPVGKVGGSFNGGYRPCRFEHTAGGTGTMQAEYFTGVTPNPGTDVVFLAPLLGIDNQEHWMVDRTIGTIEGIVKLFYLKPISWRFWDGTFLTPRYNSNVAVAKRTGNQWGFTAGEYNFETTDPARLEATFYANDNVWLQTKSLSSFSPFTFGFGDPILLDVDLPVNLLNFTAKLQNGHGLLQWTIDSDRDLLYFEVEASNDGVRYTSLGNVPANGTRYQFSDLHLKPGFTYYRIRVFEKSGHRYHSIVRQLFLETTATHFVKWLGQGTQKQPIMEIWSATTQQFQLEIFNVNGSKLAADRKVLLAGTNRLAMPSNSFAAGTYLVLLKSDDGYVHAEKWIKAW